MCGEVQLSQRVERASLWTLIIHVHHFIRYHVKAYEISTVFALMLWYEIYRPYLSSIDCFLTILEGLQTEFTTVIKQIITAAVQPITETRSKCTEYGWINKRKAL